MTLSIQTLRTQLAPVKLIAVSKTVDAERLMPALDGGQKVFGENYVQEAAAKWPALRTRYNGLELHFIGHLQSNKTDEAVKLFDAIDTLDRPSLAEALAKSMRKLNKRVPLLIEVNIGLEDQKSGCLPDAVPELLTFAAALQLDVQGLLCIPPADQDPRPHFRHMAELATANGLTRLSMGMSADYEAAMECGATEVRLGSVLFGARPPRSDLQHG